MKQTPENIQDQIVEMYTTPANDGTWTGCKIIARTLGMNTATVQNILKRRGVQTRNAVQSHANGKRCKPIVNVPPNGQEAPLCKCECGNQVAWNQRKNSWDVFVDGHYRKDALYKNSEWLKNQYCVLSKSAKDIAQDFGINPTGIYRYLRKFNIPIRTATETIVLGGKRIGANNGAWKGGIAKWAYAPNWKRIARIIRKRDNYTCQICFATFPKSSKILHVHHKDGQKFNNDFCNLVTVCATCHPKGKRKEH